MAQLSDETSGKIQREIEVSDPESKITSVVLSLTDEKNEEKLTISTTDSNIRLHSGKEISIREDERDIDRRDRIEQIRGIPIEKDKIEIVEADVRMKKEEYPIIADVRNDERKDEMRLEREISEKIDILYGRAEELAKNHEDLKFYSTHTHPHIETVAKTSLEVGYKLGYASEEMQKEILYSSLSHDLGMAGIPRDDSKSYDSKELLVDLKDVRSFHCIASAMEILRNEELYTKDGVNAGHVALEALLHSKSGSKTTNLDDPKEIYTAIERLDSEMKEKGIQTERTQEIIDDLKDLFTKDESRMANPDRIDELNMVKSVAIVTAIGDAFSHTHGTIEKGLSQAGEKEDCRFREGEESRLVADLREYSDLSKITPERETEGITIYTYVEKDGERYETGSATMTGENRCLQVAYFYGEENIRFDLRADLDKRKVVVDAEIQNGKLFPASTYLALEERVKEFPRVHLYDTSERELQIEFRIDVKDKENLTENEREILRFYFEERAAKTVENMKCNHINVKTNI